MAIYWYERDEDEDGVWNASKQKKHDPVFLL